MGRQSQYSFNQPLSHKEQLQEFVNALKNIPCLDCGGVFPPCAMDFDHVRGTKVRNISQMLGGSMSRLLKEIDKCEIVCSNCHRVRTQNRRNT